MPGSFLKTAVVVLNPERRVDFANAYAFELFSCRNAAELADALLAPEREIDQILMRARGESQETTVEVGSRKLHLQITGGEHGWLVIAHDAARLNALDRSLQAASEARARERMSGTVLHNIKGPMHAMTLALDILTKTLPEGETRQRHYLDAIRKELARLHGSLEALLSEARRASENLDLNSLISEVAKMMRVEAAMRDVGFKLNLAEDAVVNANARNIKHALATILLNALHWAPEGTEVEIKLAREESWARITIVAARITGQTSEDDVIDFHVARRIARDNGGELYFDSAKRYCFKLPLSPLGDTENLSGK